MKGPVATVELWEKGRCVFSHGVSKGSFAGEGEILR